MHTLLIHQAFVSPNEPGGTRHYELARHCVAQGQQFTIIASDHSYLTGQRTSADSKLISEQNMEGVRVLRVYTYPSLHRSFVWRVISFLSFMVSSVVAALRAGPVDLVVGTTPPIFQAVSAWLVSALRRRPFLLEIRDLWPEFAIGMGILKNPVLIFLSRRLEHFLYACATHLLVNSPAYRDYLIGQGVPAAKITLISNGVDPNMFDPNASGERCRQEWDLAGKFVVTYAGALGMANDIPTILNAADRLRDQSQIHFLLVGDGKERAKLETTARQLKLPNVTFTGSRPKSEMLGILAASDACVATLQDIPMFRTTYPNKIFDYMAAGRPTILAIDGVIRQVIEAAKGGVFVQPGDAAALAEAVSTLYSNPSEAQRKGLAARSYVVEHFNRARQSQAFASLVEHLILRPNSIDGLVAPPYEH
jgi:glycosyltransferase involved in cell wall biosynthesis